MSETEKTGAPQTPGAAGGSLTAASLTQMEGFRVAHRTQVLTILFTDLVGSTDLQSRLGNRRSAEVVGRHRSLFRDALGPFDGREVETAGDSFLVVFAAPSEAVKFALHMQAAMRRAKQSAAELPEVRVGIHQGQVVVEVHEAGGKAMDIYGLQVSTAARIMDLAGGGQVLCSRAVFDDARSILRQEDLRDLGKVIWCNHGPYRFKGVEDSYDVCEVGEEGAAPLRAPAGGSKSWPAGQGAEELGWRPAAGVVVPGTKWKLEERLGREEEAGAKFRGEFGEVWKAWNGDSKSREVFKFCFKRERVSALKREARLLKQLQKHRHPNLVEVYDVTEGDRPPYCLEMEYVDGPSLERWLGGGPSLKERLEVVAQVADALDTVHAAGIYHRDIKPSNVLLTHRQDGALLAKLTDFGLGAAEDKGLLQSIEVSRVEPVAGTWDYIAPELRAGGRASAQSDIYSLGLMLFQIVTGNLKSLAGPGWEGQIESEVLRGDIARCMASDPKNRWGHAGELAKSLRAHDDRLQRLELERRHEAQRRRARRLQVISGVAGLFAAVTLGLGGMAWFQRGEARRQRDAADEQRARAVDSERKAASERDRSQQLFAAGKSFADFAIFRLEGAIENLAGSTPARKMLVDRALAYLEGLKAHAGTDTSLLDSIASAYDAVGDVQGNPNKFNLGDVKGGLASFSAGLAIRQQLANAEPNDPQFQRDLMSSFSRIGDVQALMSNVKGAMENYRQGLQIAQRLLDWDPNSVQAQRDMAVILLKAGDMLVQTGDANGAMASYKRSLDIRQRQADADPNDIQAQGNLAASIDEIGDLQVLMGDARAALEDYRKTLKIAQRMVDSAPANAQFQRSLSVSMEKVGAALLKVNDPNKAIGYFNESLEIRRRLAAADPKNAVAQRDVSVSFLKIGNAVSQAGDGNAALQDYRKSADISQRLSDADPSNAQALRDLAVGTNMMGYMFERAGDANGAMACYGKGLEISRRLADADPTDAQAKRDLLASTQAVGDILEEKGDIQGALKNYLKCIEIAKPLADADPANAQAQNDYLITLVGTGMMRSKLGDAGAALDVYEKGLKIAEALARTAPADPMAQGRLTSLNQLVAACRRSAGDANKPAGIPSTQRGGQ